VVNSSTRSFNLLQLANGAKGVLGEASLQAGKYDQIRLLLDVGSYVVVGGTRYPITIPSGFQTGIKLVHEFQIESNFLYELYLDFDASRSIVLTGNGGYMLKPTIRVEAGATTGTISGTVLPPTHQALVTAMSATDTASTYADVVTGNFVLMALPSATYQLHIESTTAVRETTLVNVNVHTGSDTNIGVIAW
jgi:hypothetical protein